MSINIKIEVPFDIVAGILQATNESNHAAAIQIAATRTSHAVVNAVKSLPYEIKPKSDITNTAKPVISIKPSGGRAHAKEIYVWAKTLTGKTVYIDQVMSNWHASHLASRIQDIEGIPPDQQRLVYEGKQILANLGEDEDDVIDMKLDEVSWCPVSYINCEYLQIFAGWCG